MNYDLIKSVTSVKKNIDLQLEDIAFRKEGIEVELYYDTSDVIDAVLGSRGFYPPFEEALFPREKFDSKRILVLSLVTSGWFGKIRMLPPHQAEFLTRLKFYFGVGIATDPKGEARNFLSDIGLEEVNPFIDTPLEDLKNEKLYEFIKRQAGLAEKLFKAIQCMVPWHRRLARWEAHGILEYDMRKPSYDKMIENKHILKLKDEFDKKRKGTPVNNFADAMAVAILVERVNEFKRLEKTTARKTIARFYSPRELFHQAIDNAGVNSQLSYNSPLRGESSVLCDSDYLVYKAAFIPRPGRDGYNESLEFAENYLRDLSGKVAEVLKLQEKLTSGALSEIKDLTGKPLSGIIADLRQFSFLDNVWLKFEAPQDMNQALREVVEASRDLTQSDTFQQELTRVVKDTEAKLTENVEEFKWISSIWFRVERAADDLRSRVRAGSSSSEEFFRDLGLFRYAFPEGTHENIRDLLQEIVAGEQSQQAALVSVVMSSYRGRKNPTGELDRLIAASAIMLVARMYRELYSLLNRIKSLPHSSLKVVFVETLFKLRRKRERCVELIAELETEYKGAKGFQKRAELSMGIAYLYFRLWRSYGGTPKWVKTSDTSDPSLIRLRETYMNSAINYAHEAYRIFREDDLMRKVYTLNQYLYYMVEQGVEERMSDMEVAAAGLTSFRTEPEVWQYRFDDTLSRYFHLLAFRAGGAKDWEDLMDDAERLNDDALKESSGDDDVKEHAMQLGINKAKGFRDSGTAE
jgi:hypothetical protein